MLPVETPFKTYTDLSGKPLDQGYVYFGQPNQNPITSPVTVYWDAAGTMPAIQPLRTTNGYIVRAGTPANVFFDGAYSELVRNKSGVQVFYARNSDEFGVAGAIRAVEDAQEDLRGMLEVSPEQFSQPGDSDDGPALQRAIDYAIANSVSVRGLGKYRSNQTLNIRQYRLEPAVNQDFSVFDFRLNQLTYTATSGSAINVQSPTACVHIKKLIGPGADAGDTSGLYITGQGDAQHRVDWVKGFKNDVNLDSAYSHTVWIGYAHDAIVGVRINGNANKIYAGRIGGQYTDGNTGTDTTSCDIGVDIVAGAANEVHANIEYCRRTANSICLRDSGEANTFTGYLEGANAYNLYAIGRGGTYNLVSGNNKLTMPAALFAEGDNKVNVLSQQVLDQVAPADNNTTLAFDTPSQFYTYGFAEISGRQGYRERCIPTSPSSDPINQILYSNTLNGATWTFSTIGSANWANATVTANSPAYPEAGYRVGTRFVFPALPGNADIWVVTQTGRTMRAGQINYGLLLKVAAGEVDIQIRLLNADSGRQSKHVVRLKASNKWVNVGSRITQITGTSTNVQFDIQFRSTVGVTIDVANAYLVNEPVSFFPPANPFAPARTSIKGIPIDGNTFENGMNVNGAIRAQISPAISSASQFLVGDYPVTLVTGGWEGNLFLQASLYGDGHRVIVKRDGIAASGSGTMQILPSSTTVDGSPSVISIAPAYTVVELIWSATKNGWLRLR